MGNSNPHNAAAQADVLERQLQDETRRHEEELNRQREAMDQERNEGTRRREEERRRADELERQEEMRLEKLLEQNREQIRAARDREDLESKTQDSQLRTALEEGNRALDNQRGANSREAEKRADRHKDSMTNVAKQHEKVEEKTARRVLDLADQKGQAEEKLHQEKAGYIDKKLSEDKEHHAKVERLELEKIEILAKREQDKVQHQERFQILHTTFAVQTHQVHVARGMERVETNFVDAVNNIRGGDEGLRSAVGSFSRFATSLTNGFPLERAINQATDARMRAIITLAVLEDNATAILNQTENRNEDVLRCHDSARTIQGLIRDISTPLETIRDYFRADLTPKQQTSAIDLIEKIQELARRLAEAIINMPVVHRQDHVRNQLMRNVEAIANMSINGRVQAPAIQGNRNGGGVVKAPAVEDTSTEVVEEAEDEETC